MNSRTICHEVCNICYKVNISRLIMTCYRINSRASNYWTNFPLVYLIKWIKLLGMFKFKLQNGTILISLIFCYFSMYFMIIWLKSFLSWLSSNFWLTDYEIRKYVALKMFIHRLRRFGVYFQANLRRLTSIFLQLSAKKFLQSSYLRLIRPTQTCYGLIKHRAIVMGTEFKANIPLFAVKIRLKYEKSCHEVQRLQGYNILG